MQRSWLLQVDAMPGKKPLLGHVEGGNQRAFEDAYN